MAEGEINPRAVESDDKQLLGHVVVVGFHAQLGNKIEFSYPRLRGSAVLRTPRLSDSLDIGDEGSSPTTGAGEYASSGEWGLLPEAWTFLPHMALPEGAHESADDTAYFCLPPNVHCVACFRQTNAKNSVIHTAGTEAADKGAAARGSVQKSVVLLCRRPIYGVLGDRLSDVVRAYFDQGDFSRTDLLAKLFHSMNNSLSLPSWNNLSVLVYGLDLRGLVLTLKQDLLRILKLIMLEKRVVLMSQPVRRACNAVASIASVFPGAFDRMSPNMKPLDSSPEDAACGLPLELLSEHDLGMFQPYAPLPVIGGLLAEPRQGCLLGTSRNCGFVLKSAMEAAGEGSSANLPRVDTIIDLHTGEMTLTPGLAPKCALTKEEALFMDDLVHSANQSGGTSGAVEYISSDDHLRARLRDYLRRMLGSVASVDGVLQAPRGPNAGQMTAAEARRADWTPVRPFNEAFIRQWATTTHSGDMWARKCKPATSQVRGPPAPMLLRSDHATESDFGWIGDRLYGLVERMPSFLSSSKVSGASARARAYENMSGMFQRLESELKSMESLILEKVEETRNNRSETKQPTVDIQDSADITNMKSPTLEKLSLNDPDLTPRLAPSMYEET